MTSLKWSTYLLWINQQKKRWSTWKPTWSLPILSRNCILQEKNLNYLKLNKSETKFLFSNESSNISSVSRLTPLIAFPKILHVHLRLNFYKVCLHLYAVKFIYSDQATKGSDHLAHSWGDLGRFLGSQWDRHLKFSAYASFLISWSLSKFELI